MSNASLGARSYGGKRRHALAWLPWLALALLILLALGIYALVRSVDNSDSVGIAVPSSNGLPAPGGSADTGAQTIPSSGALVGGGGSTVTGANSVAGLSVPGATGIILFPENSAALDDQSRQVINRAAQLLRQQNATTVSVLGYTDVTGGTPINSNLSQRRAEAVATQLRSLLGANVRVTPIAQGEGNPVAPNSNPDGSDNPPGRAQNRRAVIAAV